MTVFWVQKDMSNSYREGTAQKLKSMTQPYKTKVSKQKLIEFYVDGIEIDDNPIGRGAERCPNVCFCYKKSRNGQKKALAVSRQPRNTQKTSKSA